MLRSLFCGCLAGALSIVACSGGSGSVSSSACSHLYSALQNYYTRCGVGALFSPQNDRASKSCEQVLSAPGSATTSGDLDSCASQIEKIPCNSSKALDVLTSCTKPGTVAVGGPCSSGIQCQSAQCSVQTPDMCGTCVATSKEGEACNPMQRCTTGLVCSSLTGAGTCAKPVYNPAGAACDSLVQRCDDNLRCDSMTKKCVAYVTSGNACMSTTECASPLVCSAQKCVDPPGQGGDCSMTFRCAANLVCDSAGTKTCVTQTFAKGGQPCSNVNLCEATLSCPASKVCPMVIADGQPCVAGDMSSTCDYAARCIDGKCAFGVATCK